MHTELTAAAAQFLSGQAEHLRRELADITHSWGNLAAKWTGIAGDAYAPAWDEWHDDAVTVTAVLVEHAEALVRAVALLVEHENQAGAALSSIVPAGQEPS
jgi:WXG100 family type VII secretion target